MKPRTPGFWLIVATVGLLALLPMKGFSQSMTPVKPKTPEEQKLAAERGDAEAQYMLGVRYYMTGMGGMNVKDQAEAIKWLRMASNQGHSNAQFMLAHCYESGQCVPMDKIEAYAYWKIGSLVNKSQQREGGPLSSDELRRGEQRAKELQKETEAKIAAKKAGAPQEEIKTVRGIQGGEYKKVFDARTHYNHGVFLFNYPKTSMDKVEGIKSFQESAEHGFVMAQHLLGKLYHSGESVEKDEVEAYAYFSLASASVEDAKNYLLIIEKDMSAEVRMQGKQRLEALKKVIASNKAEDAKMVVAEKIASTQFSLGHYYGAGDNVAKDEVEAYAYFTLAGAWFENAKRMQARMETYLSSQQITAGKERSLELQQESETKLAAKLAEQISQQKAALKKRALEFQKESETKKAGK
jgi:TPR repeat protein